MHPVPGPTVLSHSRRDFLRLLGVGTLGLAAASAAPRAALGQAGEPGGVLRVIQLNDVAPREPHLSLGVNAAIQLSVWDTLTRYDEQVQPQPVLAESWSWSEDFLSLTMHLRQGVTFHTGREFTAEDVEFNITRVREPAIGSQMRGASDQITSIERPDPYTIVLGFAAPYLAVFDMLTSLVMLDQETAGQLSEGTVIGTGPFIWREWTPNTKVVLEKNPDYWQSGPPLLDGIELTIVGDAQALSVQLEAGQQDFAVGVSSQDFMRLREDSRYTAAANVAGGGFFYLAANVAVPPLDNKAVRQAIHYALDRERAARVVLRDIGVPALLPWPENSPAYDAALNQSITFDLDRAKTMLEEAGFGSGFEIPITYNTQRTETVGKMVEIFQADLAEIGVKVNIETLENTVFQQTLNESNFSGLFAHGHGFSNLTPVTLFLQAFPFRQENASGFTSPEYSELIAAMQTEVETAKLKELYTAMNQLLLDEAFILEVSSNPSLFVTGADVRDVGYTANNWWIFHKTSFA